MREHEHVAADFQCLRCQFNVVCLNLFFFFFSRWSESESTLEKVLAPGEREKETTETTDPVGTGNLGGNNGYFLLRSYLLVSF